MTRVSRLIVVAGMFIAVTVHAQIPNAGFESWSGGDPVGWQTSNSPPTLVNVTQVAGRSGSAAQGVVVSFSGFAVPVALTAGFSMSTRPAALHGWYKYTGVGGDAFVVSIAFSKNGNGIGAAAFTTTTSQGTFTELVANSFWSTQDTPDSAIIGIQITGTVHAGSTFVIDDLSFGPASDVPELTGSLPHTFSVQQNYPNPFNPTTRIRYELPKTSHVTLTLFNTIGQQVATLVDGERSAGSYVLDFDAANLPSGAYFYRLLAGGYSSVKRMMIVK
jgi:hypothetical protein